MSAGGVPRNCANTPLKQRASMGDTVVIVDYEAGNLTSVRFAVEKLGWTGQITSDPDQILSAERVIFPGVGIATHVVDSLEHSGLGEAICEYAQTGRPLLGICIGAQVILDHSEEGDVRCLGILEGRVRRLEVPLQAKIPHMGWNVVHPARQHPLWDGIENGSQFYFVHSYAPSPANEHVTIGETDYYGMFTSAMARDNVAATQFHPERSGRVGLQLLENFLGWTP